VRHGTHKSAIVGRTLTCQRFASRGVGMAERFTMKDVVAAVDELLRLLITCGQKGLLTKERLEGVFGATRRRLPKEAVNPQDWETWYRVFSLKSWRSYRPGPKRPARIPSDDVLLNFPSAWDALRIGPEILRPEEFPESAEKTAEFWVNFLTQAKAAVSSLVTDGSAASQPIAANTNSANADLGIAQAFITKTKPFADHYLVSESGEVPFGGRDRELRQLNAWLQNEGAAPRMLVTSRAGLGKSALLVHWLRSLSIGSYDANPWQLAFMPISIRSGTSDPGTFFEGIARRLAEIIDKRSVFIEARLNADGFKGAVRDMLERIANSRHRVLVVVDGLDEALHGEIDSSAFPPILPPNLRVLLSARWQVGDTDCSGWLRRLDWDRNVRVDHLEPGPLTGDGIANVLQNLGTPFAALAQDASLISRLSELTEGEPILVRYYAEDLGPLARSGARITMSDLDTMNPGFGGYFERWLIHQEKLWRDEGLNIDRVELDRVLSILAFALGPLEERDLLELLKAIYKRDGLITVHHVLEPLRRFVIGNGQPGHGYVLSHPRLAEYFQRHGYPDEKVRIREGFVAWGQCHLRALTTGPKRTDGLSAYVVQFLRSHFEALGVSPADWMELVSSGWRLAREQFDRGTHGFAADVNAAWNVLRNYPTADNIGSQWRCALVLSSIRTVGRNTPGSLLLAAAQRDILSVKQAAHLARMGAANRKNIYALLKFVELTSSDPQESTELLLNAITKVRALRDDQLIEMVERLAPPLTSKKNHIVGDIEKELEYQISRERDSAFKLSFLVEEAAPFARAIKTIVTDKSLLDEIAIKLGNTKEWRNARPATSAAQHESGERFALFREALFAAAGPNATTDESTQATAIAWLGPHLSSADIDQAFTLAMSLPEPPERMEALEGLAHRLSPPQLKEALAATAVIGDQEVVARSLASLVSLHPLEDRHRALGDVLSFTRADSHSYFGRLSSLPASRIDDVFDNAIRVASGPAIEHLLDLVGSRLSPEQLGAALAVAADRMSISDQVSLMAAVAQHMPEDDRVTLLNDALELALNMDARKFLGPDIRILISLAPYLSPDQIHRSLTATKAAQSRSVRMFGLQGLSPYLLPEHLGPALDLLNTMPGWLLGRVEVARLLPKRQLANLLLKVRGISDHTDRAVALARLVPRLSPIEAADVQREALNAIETADDDWENRGAALSKVAPFLSPDRARDALVLAREMEEPEAVASLIPRLPPNEQAEALDAALRTAMAADDDSECVESLKRLIPLASRDRYPELIDYLVVKAATWDRALALDAAMASAPLVAEVAGSQAIQTLRRAIVDVASWYP
jgi:hypothetical protein